MDSKKKKMPIGVVNPKMLLTRKQIIALMARSGDTTPSPDMLGMSSMGEPQEPRAPVAPSAPGEDPMKLLTKIFGRSNG